MGFSVVPRGPDTADGLADLVDRDHLVDRDRAIAGDGQRLEPGA